MSQGSGIVTLVNPAIEKQKLCSLSDGFVWNTKNKINIISLEKANPLAGH